MTLVVIHAGFHKTGTTSVQTALTENAERLAPHLRVLLKPDFKPLTDADMPALETLGEDSDYSGFLSPEVSEALRKKALRKMFHLATYNITDGLDDYDEDFTIYEPLGDMITADMRHQTELQAERAREAALEDETALAASDSQEHTDRDAVDALA